MTDPMPPRGVGPILFAVALCVYGATAGGSLATDIMSYEVTKNIVLRGSVAMSYNVFQTDAHRGADGRYYAPYGIGHSIYSIPFYLAGRLAGTALGVRVGKPDTLEKAAVAGGSAVAAALSVWLAFLFGWRLTGSARAAAGASLALAFGTMLWPYAKFGFSAPLVSLCLVAGLYGVWVGVRSSRLGALALGGAALGWALLTRHELLLAAVPAVIWVWAESRRAGTTLPRRLAAVGGPVAVAVLISLYYNVVRFGNPLDTGYLRDPSNFGGSFAEGVYGLLFSPGGSIFLYSPIALAGAAALVTLGRRDPSTAWLFLAEMATLFVFYATLQHWEGDRSYGPRYLLPILPLLCVPLACWLDSSLGPIRRTLLAAAVLASIVTQLPGVLVDFSKVGYTPEIGNYTIRERRVSWTLAAITLNTRAAVGAVPRNVRYVLGFERPPAIERTADETRRDFSHQFAFSLDFWWLYLFYIGAITSPVAIGLGAAPLMAAGGLLWILRRRLALAMSHPW